MIAPEVYKFDRWLPFGFLLLLTLVVPVSSIHEYLTTGSIEWDRLSEGRRSLPMTIIYPVGWAAFLYFAVTGFAPALESIVRGYEFKIDGDVLIVAGQRIERAEVRGCRQTLFGVLIKTDDRTFRVRPGLNSRGAEALDSFLSESASG